MSNSPKKTRSASKRHFLTFRLDDRHYALPAEDVLEVIHVPVVARMPQSPAALMGLANLRGSIVPVASGRSLLGQSNTPPSPDARAIVMQGAAPVALAVDAVNELIELASNEIEIRQAKLAPLPGELLQGAFQSVKSRQIIKLLDVKGLLSAAFVPRLREQHSPRQQNALQSTMHGPTSTEVTRSKLVSFEIAGQIYALPLESVQEIVAAPGMLAAMPHAETLVLGVASFRDGLLPLLSLRGLLGFTRSAHDREKEKIVVTTVAGHPVGLVVDAMGAIFPVEEARIEPVPKILAARMGGESKVTGIYRGERSLVSILAPDQLFGDEIMRTLNTVHASAIPDSASQNAPHNSRQFLVFQLGGEEFGLPIEAVEEVARVPDTITRLPKTPKFLEGVVNLRGEVLPVVDQRRRFNMPPQTQGVVRRLIVVRTEHHLAGLIVDSVSEVLRSAIDAIDPTPDLTGETVKLVHSVINLENQNRIVLLLDPAELLTRAERGLLDAFNKQQGAPEPS